MVVPVISLDEYLASSYQPDCDFVDGVLEERNFGMREHSRLQVLLARYFANQEPQWKTVTYTEARVQVSPTRVRVPDVCLTSEDAPLEAVFTHPPLLCVEILSPDDRMIRVEVRVQEFLAMGVPCVWVFDPIDRTVLEITKGGRRVVTGDVLQLLGTPVSVNLPELFAQLK